MKNKTSDKTKLELMAAAKAKLKIMAANRTATAERDLFYAIADTLPLSLGGILSAVAEAIYDHRLWEATHNKDGTGK